MARYDIEFGKLGDGRPVPDLTVQTTDPDVLGRTVADHARPHITPVLTEMGHPEYADCLFRTFPDRSMGEFLWLDLAGARGVAFLAARITTTPERIQRKRIKGWTAPAGAKYVGRGTRWGNPYRLGETQVRVPALDGSDWEHEGRLHKTSGERHAFVHPDKSVTWHLAQNATPEQVVELYRRWIAERPPLIADARRDLRGRDLMCWCPLPEPGQPDHCHAAVLLELANASKEN
ncbi:DUF4326 domain-containing protein [Streptomyces sp. NPDC059802]|uniref:DUF4326 domain-containing protein n=1 Tax=Streptomyces sp. NPDC059802 TaxID=3346952 RepID=UPI003669AAA1